MSQNPCNRTCIKFCVLLGTRGLGHILKSNPKDTTTGLSSIVTCSNKLTLIRNPYREFMGVMCMDVENHSSLIFKPLVYDFFNSCIRKFIYMLSYNQEK
jgi:hypothetical protein